MHESVAVNIFFVQIENNLFFAQIARQWDRGYARKREKATLTKPKYFLSEDRIYLRILKDLSS